MSASNYKTCSKCGMIYHTKAGYCPKCGIISFPVSGKSDSNEHKPGAHFQEKCKRIAKEMGDDRFFTKKEINYLPEILRPEENILGFASGLMDGNTWLITLTDRRIIFLDKGMLYGLKQSIVDLNKVNSVSGKTGLIFGDITITDGAGHKTITNVPKKTVKPFTNKVQEAMEALPSPTITNQPQQANVQDPIELLEKLAKLKSQGILTEEEFLAKKGEILASM